jgi:predicted outer membrane repeat protein
MNLLPNPLWLQLGRQLLAVADFTHNSDGTTNGCTVMDGSPVIFGADNIDVIISPTLGYVVAGQAQTTLYDSLDTNTFLFCAQADTDLSSTGYTYCVTATPLVLTAIWVSAIDGDDANMGNSPSNPVRTIAHGLELLNSGTTGTVYLYLETGNTFTGASNKDLTITLSDLYIGTYTGSHGITDPVIDMQGSKRFCTINPGISVTMNSLIIQNGNVNSDCGAAIYNSGNLDATGCTFSSNSAANGAAIFNINGTLNTTGCIFSNNNALYGGAIENDGNLIATGCTFGNNSAGKSGGAIYNSLSTATVTCSRFVGNTATAGNAIYNQAGTVIAINNWWGTNVPNVSALFGASTVDYVPYLVVNFIPSPMSPRLQCPYSIAADFTQNSSGNPSGCTIFEGVPVRFSSTESIEPTLSYVLNGYADTTLYDIPNTNTFTVCLYTDSDLTTSWYQFCTTATPRNLLAVYVSPNGNDSNLGDTPSNPVQTISVALQHISCITTGTIYLETGATFTGQGNTNITISFSVNFSTYGTDADPIIDMQGLGQFCTINSTCTVTINNLIMQNGTGDIHGYGGALTNNGILYANSCTFSGNSSAAGGGALYNNGNTLNAIGCIFSYNTVSGEGGAINNVAGTLTVANCTFNNNYSSSGGGAIQNDSGTLDIVGCTLFSNSTPSAGGALFNYVGTATVTCSRFVGNAAGFGSAIFNGGGTVNAQNCWWGTNTPDAGSLFSGPVTYKPYIVLNLFPNLLWPRLGCQVPVLADFTQNSSGQPNGCTIMEGTPVIFSVTATDVVISPTLSYVVNGQAETTLYDIPDTNTFSVCAETDTDLSTTGYTYCQTATPLAIPAAYVSAIDGNDDYPGTQDYPVRTIAHGLELLNCVSTGTAYLYLEAGNTFTGTGNTNLTITLSNLYISTYTGSHGTANPIIDMQNSGRFCIIDADITVTMYNLVMQHGTVIDVQGGAVYNSGTLNIINCIFANNMSTLYGVGGAIENFGTLNATSCVFNNNNAVIEGGAIDNHYILNAAGCTFSNNSASTGGAIFNGSTGAITVICSRFIGNIASPGSAIYNSFGTVNAQNNWWGTNTPNPTSLFYGQVTYKPYIVMNLFPNPLWPRVQCASPVTADFTQNSSGQPNGCTIMEGMPVIFSVTAADVIISPTLSYVVAGLAQATLYDIPGTSTFSVCAETDTDLSTIGYTYCETATPLASMAVYVSATSGNDEYPGTQAYPVQTIARGLVLVQCATTATIYLEAGNTFTGNNNINLTLNINNLTIDRYGAGADPILDMSGMPAPAQFCTIVSTVTVTMNNLVLQNGYADDVYGGAIYNYGTLLATGCTFSGNSSARFGGAIENAGTLNATGCTFSNNSAGSEAGGAISNDGTLNVAGCTFSNNSAGGGAAIYNLGNLNATGCTFINNSAGGGAGGAIYNSLSTATVTCSRFVGNTATSGHAIYNQGGIVTAQNNWWGTNDPDAHVLFGVSTVDYIPYLVVNFAPSPMSPRLQCPYPIAADFTQNSSGQVSGCTIFEGVPVHFSSTESIEPTLSYVLNGYADTTLYDILSTNTFTVCLYADSDLTTTWYQFCTTATPRDLLAVYVSPSGNDNNLGDTPFNPVRTIARALQHVSCVSVGTIYLEAGATFTGAGNNDLVLTSSVNFDRYGLGVDPIIDMQGVENFCTVGPEVAVSMSNLVLANGHANDGGAIACFNDTSVLTLSLCTFNSNAALNGGAILTLGDLMASNCVFNDNAATSGGALYADTLTLSDCTFNSNAATNGPGGALLLYGTLTASGCTFNGNSATGATGWGGAIFNTVSSAVSGCTFDGNVAVCGGALYNYSNGQATVSCCRLVDNSATSSGNAIYNASATTAVQAQNNWWGFNSDPSALLYGDVSYAPWIELSVSINPLLVYPGQTTVFAATFSSSCIPDGTPIAFSTTDGAITPTFATTVDGQATAIVTLSYDGLPFVVTAIVAPEAEAFELSLTITPITITLAKSASYTTLLPGDTIDYRYVMRNIGSTDLFNILLTDNRFSSTICSNPLLEQAETMTCTASYIITQADVDSGVITNTATAYATDVGGDQFVVTSSLTIPIAQLPSIQLVKTATYSLLLPSYPIEYLYAVQNTGNVTLQNIVLTDNRFTDTICTQATLAPAETMNCSATYIITQTDRTNESVTNIATAAGYPPSGIPVTYSDSLTITIPQPSMTLLKLINSNDASATWPGLIVPLGSTMALNYQVKNTGNVALYAVQVTDDQGYHIIQPKTTLAPDESMTCTATAVAPALNALHVNNATVTATSVDILPITSTASAYATSVAIGLYRINWGCTCTDMNTRHLLVGSHNSGDLNNNILDGWIFDPTITPSCQELTPLALGSQVIVCSAVYTSTEETVIAVLIQDQGGSSYVIVATVEGTNIVLQSMTQLPSVAFKLQWYGENSGEAYLVTDEYENISLYSVDLSSYTLTRIATTPNLAAGVPSTFLCWFPQSSDIYIVQGYNATNIVTYKVNLGASTIDNGVVTNVASVYSHVNACSTCYNYLVLGGIRGTESLLGYHWINGSGHIGGPLPYTSFAGATTVNYCERCCCNNDHLLVGTDSGLYSVDAQTFAIVATNTTMSVNNWVNVCWCCASNKTYCAASDGASNGFIFKEQSGALEPVYNL